MSLDYPISSYILLNTCLNLCVNYYIIPLSCRLTGLHRVRLPVQSLSRPIPRTLLQDRTDWLFRCIDPAYPVVMLNTDQLLQEFEIGSGGGSGGNHTSTNRSRSGLETFQQSAQQTDKNGTQPHSTSSDNLMRSSGRNQGRQQGGSLVNLYEARAVALIVRAFQQVSDLVVLAQY